MKNNEAIAAIAQSAISHIHQFALETMQMLKEDGQPIATIGLGGNTTEVVAAVAESILPNATMPVTRRGRPKVAEKPPEQAISTIERDPEVLDSPTANADEDTLEFSIADKVFPAYSDTWFAKNTEKARDACRALLSVRLKQNGSDTGAVKKEIADLTGKSNVSSFDADACAKYYRAAVPLVRADAGDDEGELM